MGNSKMKEIENKIEEEYRSSKRFSDDFFEEVTLVKEKSTNIEFVKIEKMYGIDQKLVMKKYLK